MVQATFVPFLLRRIAGLTRGDQHLRELFIEPAYAGKLAYVCAAACSGNVRFCRVPLGLPMRVQIGRRNQDGAENERLGDDRGDQRSGQNRVGTNRTCGIRNRGATAK